MTINGGGGAKRRQRQPAAPELPASSQSMCGVGGVELAVDVVVRLYGVALDGCAVGGVNAAARPARGDGAACVSEQQLIVDKRPVERTAAISKFGIRCSSSIADSSPAPAAAMQIK